nr:unnamed protein product [Digitaria exilis]
MRFRRRDAGVRTRTEKSHIAAGTPTPPPSRSTAARSPFDERARRRGVPRWRHALMSVGQGMEGERKENSPGHGESMARRRKARHAGAEESAALAQNSAATEGEKRNGTDLGLGFHRGFDAFIPSEIDGRPLSRATSGHFQPRREGEFPAQAQKSRMSEPSRSERAEPRNSQLLGRASERAGRVKSRARARLGQNDPFEGDQDQVCEEEPPQYFEQDKRAVTSISHQYQKELSRTEYRHLPRRRPGTEQTVVVGGGPTADPRLNVLARERIAELEEQLAKQQGQEDDDERMANAWSPPRKKLRYGAPFSVTQFRE